MSQIESSKRQPIVLKNRRLACQNSMFNIYFDEIDDGIKVVPDYLVIMAKQNLTTLVGGVAVLPIWDGKFGLVKIFRHPMRNYSLEIPRGFRDEGEDLTRTAQRELLEEMGLHCELNQMHELGDIAPEGGVMASRIKLFMAKNCTKVPPKAAAFRAELGLKEVCFYTPEQVHKMILASEIQDPSTVKAIYHWCFEYGGLESAKLGKI